jgi:hypothetical protein
VIEADFSRYYNIDLRDHWRFDSQGRRILTLRMIKVRLKYLPTNSAFHLEIGSSGWQLEHYLMAHIFQATAGQPHPGLPKAKAFEDPIRKQHVSDALERKKQREEAIKRGDIS